MRSVRLRRRSRVAARSLARKRRALHRNSRAPKAARRTREEFSRRSRRERRVATPAAAEGTGASTPRLRSDAHASTRTARPLPAEGNRSPSLRDARATAILRELAQHFEHRDARLGFDILSEGEHVLLDERCDSKEDRPLVVHGAGYRG